MSDTQHSTNPHQLQHGQLLLDPIAPHCMYREQDVGSLHESSPVVLERNAFQDFTFSYAGTNQSDMMDMPDGSFTNNIDVDFTRHPAWSSNRLPVTHHRSVVPGPSDSDFYLDASRHGQSSEVIDGDYGERNTPTENSFEDTGTDEFGLPGNSRAEVTYHGGTRGDDKSSAPPAWSELKTKAGKDRKRLPLACIACRRKKIRCSGEKPACKHCFRSRIPCVYKVTTRKAAPRTDYMAMLDKRLKRMEDRIIKIIPKPDQDATSFVTRAIVKPAILGSSSGNKSSYKKRGAENAFGTDLEFWAKSSLNMANFRGSDGVEEIPVLAAGSISDEDLLLLEGIDALPSKDVQEHLAEIFFDNVYGQAYQLLHKPSYMRKLKNNTLPPVLVLSVCAVAARFAPQSTIVGTVRPFLRGEEWASHARDICTRRYEWPNVTVLTCLLILGLHEFGTCHGGRSWALGGQAIRMAFALQLHKDLKEDTDKYGHKSPLSFIDQEIRRRIMWACFLMDRFNSSGSDRPMFIKEESIEIQLPVKESYFQLGIPAQTEPLAGLIGQPESHGDGQEGNMGVAAYIIRAIAIWGRIVTHLYHGGKHMDEFPLCHEQSTYAKLVQQIDDLQRNLPEPLQYTIDNLNLHATENTAGQFVLMHLSIQQNVMFLHKAAMTWVASNGGEDAHSEFLSRASARTVAAANSISEILKDAEQNKCIVTAPFAGYCAFSATNILIFSMFSGNAAAKTAAEINAGINIRFLRKLMRYWGMFYWMVENIRARYRDAVEAASSGKSCAQGTGEWLTLQYADWFNRYPHGVVSDHDVVEPIAKQIDERGGDAVLEQKPEMQSVEEYFTSLASPPPSTEGGTTAHGSANSQRRMTMKSSECLRNPAKKNRRISDASIVQSDTGSLKKSGRRPASGQPCTTIGGQTAVSASAGYHSVSLPNVGNQPYAAISPMSPAQPSPYSLMGLGQHPFYGQDVLQIDNASQQGAADLPRNIDARVPFGCGLSGEQNIMMDSGVLNWQAKHTIDNKVLHQNQQAIEMNSGLPPARSLHDQGQIGADGLVELNGGSLPAGWFMPFNNINHRVDFRDACFSKDGEAISNGIVDPFHNSMLRTNGIGVHQTMNGVRDIL
ncbi:hypothetical protein E4U32_001528 [Claviceps aff. humidiphila group G2b]|nr:hypothetical protein E4U32_001528 [Claviceps aff. humidiphila group G2b]